MHYQKIFNVGQSVNVRRVTKVYLHVIIVGYHDCHMYIQTDAPAEYEVDDLHIEEFVTHDDWRTRAEKRIEKHRKADITIK